MQKSIVNRLCATLCARASCFKCSFYSGWLGVLESSESWGSNDSLTMTVTTTIKLIQIGNRIVITHRRAVAAHTHCTRRRAESARCVHTAQSMVTSWCPIIFRPDLRKNHLQWFIVSVLWHFLACCLISQQYLFVFRNWIDYYLDTLIC